MTTLMTTGDEVLDEIRAAWTHGAASYDEDPAHGLMTPLVEDAWLSALSTLCGSAPKDVLDVGAGTGYLSVLLAKLGHRVTSLDLTPAMIEHGKARAQQAGVDVTFKVGDAMALPFEHNEFDMVVSRHLLWTLPEPERAFREWTRVTRPGGQVAWFDQLQPQRGKLARAATRAGKLVPNRLRRPGDTTHQYDVELTEHLPFQGLTTTQPIRELLASLGIGDVSCRAMPGVTRAERSVLPLRERVKDHAIRYAGRYPVTFELKEQFRDGEARGSA